MKIASLCCGDEQIVRQPISFFPGESLRVGRRDSFF